MYIPPRLTHLKMQCETMIVLPYALTIVDCHFLYTALVACGGAPYRTEVDGKIDSKDVGSAFDLYAFDRELDDVEAILMDRTSHSFFYWDERERFVAVGGSREFCDLALPYPYDVRKHYYLEGMSPPLSQNEASDLYALLSEG